MEWIKKGRIWKPDKKASWRQYYGILPTPLLLDDDRLRIFFATTDSRLVGYITFIDVDANNPSRILYKHPYPVLNPGEKGMFDEHGVNPSSIIRKNGSQFLLYVGYQKQKTVPYTLFTGLACWNKRKQVFERVQRTPVLDRKDDELFFRTAAFALPMRNLWKIWYVSGNSWIHIHTGYYRNRIMPTYTIRSATSNDLVSWQNDSHTVLPDPKGDVFGYGRPWIIKDGATLQMWYSIRYASLGYRFGFAESSNGKDWIRKDKKLHFGVSSSGWDSKMVCYPAIIQTKNSRYLFYNGNRHGRSGFGYAELSQV